MSKYVLVESLIQYRMRYIVEVPDNHNDGDYPYTAEQWAEDTVACEQATEFSQLYLGETIISARKIRKEKIVPLCDKDNEYCQAWNDEKKIEMFVTPIGYKKDY